jgi:hypothetical protein
MAAAILSLLKKAEDNSVQPEKASKKLYKNVNKIPLPKP